MIEVLFENGLLRNQYSLNGNVMSVANRILRLGRGAWSIGSQMNFISLATLLVELEEE